MPRCECSPCGRSHDETVASQSLYGRMPPCGGHDPGGSLTDFSSELSTAQLWAEPRHRRSSSPTSLTRRHQVVDAEPDAFTNMPRTVKLAVLPKGASNRSRPVEQ